MSESPSPLLYGNCQKGIHHELQIIERCVWFCSNTVREEHAII
jgi:hypothetical protein